MATVNESWFPVLFLIVYVIFTGAFLINISEVNAEREKALIIGNFYFYWGVFYGPNNKQL